MSEAVLTLIVSAIIQIIGILMNNSLTKFRLDQLDKRVEKISAQGEKIALAEQSVRSAHRRIDALSAMIK